MINVNELRRGNFIKAEGFTQCVLSIFRNTVVTAKGEDEKQRSINGLHEIEPIPLTDEVMKKTEFKTDPLFINKTNRIYSLGRLLIEVKQELRKAAIYFDGTLFCYIPANLHSLQNFYFATMGEELTIKH
ncbi:hypothetical protein [Marinifilum flexuosum]|uniref:Uncharacterized protein n=1 Tax=Marinifilum flexuosum TaxID=1117708 RepID=A0A419WMU8_9BACT|nr:hypothetical protein [Marinifilum flexuosum]RKD96758.1 hypothetical protein BXY64_3704 [Marinifilum flexuosum]